VVMLALGAKKAAAVAAMVEGPLGEQCPASALQMHPSTTVVLDPEAAQLLRLKDAYRQAHPDAGVGT
jgi:glucosamine-6-phosphate deaminase